MSDDTIHTTPPTEVKDGLGYEAGSYCDTFACEWVEEYYGWRCSKCGLFYAFGQSPWEDFDDEL
jgi:hypothetical protein